MQHAALADVVHRPRNLRSCSRGTGRLRAMPAGGAVPSPPAEANKRQRKCDCTAPETWRNARSTPAPSCAACPRPCALPLPSLVEGPPTRLKDGHHVGPPILGLEQAAVDAIVQATAVAEALDDPDLQNWRQGLVDLFQSGVGELQGAAEVAGMA